jgi:hypothetical protein
MFLEPGQGLVEITVGGVPPIADQNSQLGDLIDHGKRPNFHCIAGMAGAYYRACGTSSDKSPVNPDTIVGAVRSILVDIKESKNLDTVMRYPLERGFQGCRSHDHHGRPFSRIIPCVEEGNTAQEDWLSYVRGERSAQKTWKDSWQLPESNLNLSALWPL